ncbi:MAG: hypothetical protein GY756_08400 [bacterium]|nr:hypothetical protein [bacterium]
MKYIVEEYKQIKLLQIIDECNKHISKIIFALNSLAPVTPFDIDTYNSLKEIDISYLDQFIFRFSKLQDCMGEKLFKSFMLAVEEEVKTKTFIDILNRLEELELLNTSDWKILRELRNNIAHEYSSSENEIIETLNTLFLKFELLYKIFINIKKYILDHNLINKELFTNSYKITTDKLP